MSRSSTITIPPDKFGPWAKDISSEERSARWRTLAALVYCYLGSHPLLRLCILGEHDERYVEAAWLALNDLDPLPLRRLLSGYAAIDALVVTNRNAPIDDGHDGDEDELPKKRRARR